MKTVEVMGLGAISRLAACEIAVCDEMGADETFWVGDAITRTGGGFTEKEIRQAIFELTKSGELVKVRHATYKWREHE